MKYSVNKYSFWQNISSNLFGLVIKYAYFIPHKYLNCIVRQSHYSLTSWTSEELSNICTLITRTTPIQLFPRRKTVLSTKNQDNGIDNLLHTIFRYRSQVGYLYQVVVNIQFLVCGGFWLTDFVL